MKQILFTMFLLTSFLLQAQEETFGQKGMPGGCIQIPGEEGRTLPLLHTGVKTSIDGILAQTVLNQTFKNDTSNTLELTYIFPMPHRAAIGHYQFTIGKRTIEGTIQTKEKAREIYEQARAEGKTAALLEQQRPNIFTQDLTNIPAGASIEVQITYDEIIFTEDGQMEWVLPMVVGPRFMPENAKATPQANPVYQSPESRDSNTISLQVDMKDAGQLGTISSGSHAILVQRGNTTTITLDKDKTIPNKDFILKFSYLNAAPDLTISSFFDGNGSPNNTFLITLLPPSPKTISSQILPREFFFILDVSGSMYGQPMDKAIATMKACMTSLRQDDTFQILTFAGSTAFFKTEPVHPTRQNLTEAMEFLNSRQSGGGTYMMQAIQQALGAPKDPERYRMAVMFTDGYIGNESEIISGIKKLKDSSRMFTFGIGSSVNRYLIESMGRAGNGFSEIVPLNADLNQTASRWENRLRSPVLSNLKLNISGVDVSELLPLEIPDLFAGEPVLISGHFSQKGTMKISLTGQKGGENFELNKSMKIEASSNPVVPKIWAREKIRDLDFALTDTSRSGQFKEFENEITQLGLNYRLMTAYTSFVAVDSQSNVSTQGRIHSNVEVPLPEGVSGKFLGGNAPARTSLMTKPMSPAYKEKKNDGAVRSEPQPLEEVRSGDIAESTTAPADDETDKDQPKSESGTASGEIHATCRLLYKTGQIKAIGLILEMATLDNVKLMNLKDIDGKHEIELKPSMLKSVEPGIYHLLFDTLKDLKPGTWILDLGDGSTFQFTI